MQTIISGPCPVCNAEIEYLYQTEEIPFFSEMLIIRARCESCGYRYVDTQILKDAEPLRYELDVDSPEDLNIRVVRSTRCAMEIPELGVRVDPGPACEGFVSNVEGVIDRVEQVVDGVLTWASQEERENACILKKHISAVRKGEMPITLILEDSSGNSAIIADKARKIALLAEED
ncbi:MAG: ZPR1 zinc finger domain-containing protein [Methanoregulaceae archaeon]|nr:ZPR1 zinc finger domain-containing protein [Methanoregulaceae archaeon]